MTAPNTYLVGSGYFKSCDTVIKIGRNVNLTTTMPHFSMFMAFVSSYHQLSGILTDGNGHGSSIIFLMLKILYLNGVSV